MAPGKSKRRKTASRYVFDFCAFHSNHSSSKKETSSDSSNFLQDLIVYLDRSISTPIYVGDKHPLCLKLTVNQEELPKSSNEPGDISVYYLVLAVHCLQRLIVQTNGTPADDALVGLAYVIAKALPKLSSGRAVLGRALVTVTIASIKALETSRHRLLAVLALDAVIPQASSQRSQSHWNNFKKSLGNIPIPSSSIETTGNWKLESAIFSELNKGQIPDMFDRILINVDGGRLALKRYTAICICWYGNSLDTLYNTALEILDDPKNLATQDMEVCCRIIRLAHEVEKAAGAKPLAAHSSLDKFFQEQLKLKRSHNKQKENLELAQKLVRVVPTTGWSFESQNPRIDWALADLPGERVRVLGAALALCHVKDADLAIYSLRILAELLQKPKSSDEATTDLRLTVPLFMKRKRKDILDNDVWNLDEELSIFVRAATGESLWNRILSILDACLDDEPAAKRKAEPSSTTRKRRKRGKNAPPEVIDSPKETLASREAAERHFSGSRGELTLLALKVLTLMARSSISELNLSKVQGMFRNMLDEEDILRMVDLGAALEKRLGPKEGATELETSIREQQCLLYIHLTAGHHVSSKPDFDNCASFEFCEAMFRQVATHGRRLTDDGWTMALAPLHRILVSSALVCRPSDDDETPADHFVVDGFVEELSVVLDRSSDFLFSSEECPLSLDNARIVLLAFSYLSVKKQKSSLATLLALVDRSMQKMKASGAAGALSPDFCSFLARLTVVVTHAYIMMLFGKPAHENLRMSLRDPLYSFDSSSAGEYMGVFCNYNLAALPNWDFTTLTSDKKSETMLQRTLENALALGFQVADVDACHLLYAAWNCLGKRDLWNDPSTKIQLPASIPKSDLHLLLDELRNDACVVSNKISKLDVFEPPGTTIAKVTAMKQGKTKSLRSSAAEVKKDLQTMIKKAAFIVDCIDSLFIPTDPSMDQDIPKNVFSLLDACMHYVAFAASCFTVTPKNYFVATKEAILDRARGSRDRGYSTDSDVVVHSDCGSVDSEDVLADAIERLQDVCECIGGAPAHPDWLDKTCKVLASISHSEIVGAANEALVCLTRIAEIGIAQETKARYRALQKLCPNASEKNLFLCLNLRSFDDDMEKSPMDPYVGDGRDFEADIAAACGISVDAMKIVADNFGGSRHNAVRSWCPGSAQRIVGQLEESFFNNVVSELASSHLRATGEWEVLLSTSLSFAGITLDAEKRDGKYDVDALNYVTTAGRWSEICWTALDCLIPISALLRFGLCSGGRIQHPLSLLENPVDEFEPEAVEEELEGCSIPAPIRSSIAETIAALAVFGDSPACNAVVSHLSQSSGGFADLKGIEISALTLDALVQMVELFEGKRTSEAAGFIVKRLASVLQIYGFERENYSCGEELPNLLLTCLSKDTQLPSTVSSDFLDAEINPMAKLSKYYLTPLRELGMSECWNYCGSKDHYMYALMSFVWGDELAIDRSVRRFFVELVVALLAMERKEQKGDSITSSVLSEFNQTRQDELESLVREEICLLRGSELHLAFCGLFANLLATSKLGTDKVAAIYRVIEITYEDWRGNDFLTRERITQLGFLYACRTNSSFEFGENFFEDLKQPPGQDGSDRAVENMHLFASALDALSLCLSERSSAKEKTLFEVGFPKLPSCCTYAVDKDFQEQHWYNCFTCGLTADKGCCTLCALVCHDGHDVEYARYSSFFCDCGGAGDASRSESMKCRCLEPGSRNKLLELLKAERQESSKEDEIDFTVISGRMCSAIVQRAFPNDGEVALATLSEKGRRAAWIRQLFDYTRRRLDLVCSQDENAFAFSGPLCSQDFSYPVFGHRSSSSDARPIKQLLAETFALAVTTKTAAFQTGLCSDMTEEITKRRVLSTHGVTRSIADSDCRGRSVIVEDDKLVFYSAFPILDIWSKNAFETKFVSRSSFCIVSTVPVGMEVVGVRFSSDTEGLLLVWALETAKIVFMKKNLSAVHRIASLGLAQESRDDASPVVDCQWISGTPFHVLVAGRDWFRLYDLRRSGSVLYPSQVMTAQGDGPVGAVVGFSTIQLPQVNANGDLSFKLLALHACGSLRMAEIHLRDNGGVSVGSFASPGDMFGSPNPISFPPDTSTSSDAGGSEGDFSSNFCQLQTLTQSNVVLYQRSRTGVTAIPLSSTAESMAHFELLPYELPISLFGDSTAKITGPYLHWREIGTVIRGSSYFYRLSCVGSSENGHTLLIVEFNEAETRIQQLSKPNDEFGTRQWFEGVAAFSAPFVVDTRERGSLVDKQEFHEKIALLTASRSGTLRMYVEKVGTPTLAFLQSPTVDELAVDQRHTGMHSNRGDKRLQLVAFEHLRNMSDSFEIEMNADGLGDSESVRSRLAADSGDTCLRSPRRDGFTITVSVPTDSPSPPNPTTLSTRLAHGTKHEPVLAAIRVLVGASSLDNIPVRISVMGTCALLAPGVKRWYCFRLTPQEMAMSIRNGFVAINIDQSIEYASGPVVDAVEVYAIERRDIERWLPGTLPVSSSVAHRESSATQNLILDSPRESFAVSLSSLTIIKKLIGKFKPNRTEKAFLRRMIQETCFDTDRTVGSAVSCLVASLEPSESFCDNAVLAGCSALVRKCQRYFSDISTERNVLFDGKWLAFSPLLRMCLQIASSIAIKRPFNYLQALEENPASVGLIASDSCKLIVDCSSASFSTEPLISDLVELALMEIAVANLSPRQQSCSFDGLRSLLASPNQTIVDVTCSSISQFCRKRSDFFAAQLMAVKYACDSCLAFIEDTRYTLLDQEHSFDLCPECYRLGKQFIGSSSRSDNTNVLIRGKTVGETQKLRCRDFKLLQSVAIVNPTDTKDQGLTVGAECAEPQQLFDDFMDSLFGGVGEILGKELKSRDSIPVPLSMLCVDLIRHNLRTGRQIGRAKALARDFSKCLNRRISTAMTGALPEDSIALLDGLACLVATDTAARRYFSGATTSRILPGDGNPRDSQPVMCDHGEQACLLKFAGGPDSSRSFFACSRDTGPKCGFFRWQDNTNRSRVQSGGKSDNIIISTSAADLIWELLESCYEGCDRVLHLRMLDLVDRYSKGVLLKPKSKTAKRPESPVMLQANHDSKGFLTSGAFCSVRRLNGEVALANLAAAWHRRNQETPKSNDICTRQLFLHHSLELMALVGRQVSGNESKWLPVLANIVVADKSQVEGQDDFLEDLQSRSQLSLQRFCGQDPLKVREVLNHFSFAYKFEQVLKLCEELVKTFVMLNEKARQCRPTWQTSAPREFGDLSLGDLAGAENLISEDVCGLRMYKSTSKILNDLMLATEKVGGSTSWRKFCSLERLPVDTCFSSGGQSCVPPIKLLLALACGFTPSSNQIRAIKLINLALARTSASGEKSPQDDHPAAKQQSRSGLISEKSTCPEDVLKLCADDVYSFVMRFVCRGGSSEIRTLASGLALKLSQSLDSGDQGPLLVRLAGAPLAASGVMGKLSVDYLNFLQSVFRALNRAKFDLERFSGAVRAHFKKQLLAIRHDGANGEFMNFETRSGTSIQKKRYDLAKCGSCRLQIPRSREKPGEKSSSSSGGNDGDLGTSGGSAAKAKWLPDQVSPYVRCRLEMGQDSCASTAFCSFFSLKNRQVISGIHFEADNPRRFIKTIKIYFSPRPVEKPEILKSDQFSSKWQHCGTLNLSRGCTSIALTFSNPVVAANLKMEYAEFHERLGAKLSDGSFVVLCPRCTRAVSNAHGVCGNCGEVAFQCRKCRNIDYDRLDAFLCVECGFCVSGNFHYDIVAGVASNAVAITNDSEFERMQQMSTLSGRLEAELRNALKQKLQILVRGRKTNANIEDDIEQLGSKSLKLAFKGLLSPDGGDEDDEDYSQLTMRQLGKTGSIVKLIARPQSGATSWFRSTRRQRTTNSYDRTERIIIRNAVDGGEDDADIFSSLLEGPGGLSRYAAGLDTAVDPLSQLLANVKSRRELRESNDRGERGGDGAPQDPKPPAGNNNNAKETIEVCDRLHQLMREAEREKAALDARIDAWKRLESGSLTGSSSKSSGEEEFEPSHCSSCAPIIANSLLSLWLRLFEQDPQSVVVTKEFIKLLLNGEPSIHGKTLHETRRSAIKAIALKSEKGAPLVLEMLRLRLTLLDDTSAAEILGKILESAEGEAARPFADLAREALESGAMEG